MFKNTDWDIFVSCIGVCLVCIFFFGMIYGFIWLNGRDTNVSYHTCLSNVGDARFCWESIYQGSNSVTDYAKCDTVQIVSSSDL